MYLALKFSNYIGFCDKKLIDLFCNHLNQLNIPYKLSDYKIKISTANFLKHIKFDKKIKNNKIKLILLKSIAKPTSYIVNDENLFKSFLQENLI